MTIRAFMVGLVAVGLVVGATSARAEPVKCQRDLAKASSKYVQGRAKALDKCENAKTKAKLPPTTLCATETKTALALGKLDGKLSAGLARACGGADKTCGNGDDDTLASIGWNTGTCPDFESSGCANAIASCTDITTCLKCIHDVAVDQAIALSYAALQQSEFGSNSAVNKCQQAIGKAMAKFLLARSKALQKCWDARLKNQHALICPADATGKTALLIGKAETKKIDTICTACGGPDKRCGGGDDLTPTAIGFVASCPPAETFDATMCAASIGDTSAIVACVDCLTELKTDCMDAAAVPALRNPLPGVCNLNNNCVDTCTGGSCNCTSRGCFWRATPDAEAWDELDNGVNPPNGQGTVFDRSGLTYRQVLDRPSNNEAYFLCAYQLIAVQLNELNGVDTTDVEDSYGTAREIFELYSPGDVATDALLDQRLRSLALD